jgi:hypothetical protein
LESPFGIKKCAVSHEWLPVIMALLRLPGRGDSPRNESAGQVRRDVPRQLHERPPLQGASAFNDTGEHPWMILFVR